MPLALWLEEVQGSQHFMGYSSTRHNRASATTHTCWSLEASTKFQEYICSQHPQHLLNLAYTSVYPQRSWLWRGDRWPWSAGHKTTDQLTQEQTGWLAGIYWWRTKGFKKQLRQEGAGQAGAHSPDQFHPHFTTPPHFAIICIFTLSFHSKNISALCKLTDVL